MVHREIIAVCSEIHTKHTNTLCGQNVELLNVKLVVHIVTNGLQGGETVFWTAFVFPLPSNIDNQPGGQQNSITGPHIQLLAKSLPDISQCSFPSEECISFPRNPQQVRVFRTLGAPAAMPQNAFLLRCYP
jgi:hypothetical protein